jgi:TMEM175 potassium channel family protein
VKFDSGTDRLEIFSDAVIAIAITLLVLDIKVPTAREGQLVHDLGQIWPSYVAYALSFAVIGIMWVSHHSMFERIHHVDRGLLFYNLWLLLGIGFLPFPTALLAEYARQGGSNSHAAAAVYSATMMFIGFAFLAIWLHLARHPRLLGDKASSASLQRSIRLSMVSPVVYGASIGLAFISAEACFVVYGLAALYFACGPSSRALSRLLERSSDAPREDQPARRSAPTERPAAPGDGRDRSGTPPAGTRDAAVGRSAPSVPEDRGSSPTY